MSEVETTAFGEGSDSIPLPRRDRTTRVQERDSAAPVVEDDVEPGVPLIPANLTSWLVRATDIDPGLAASLTDSPEAAIQVLDAAREQAQAAYTDTIARRGQTGLGRLANSLRWSTAYTDVTHSPEYRELMRDLELPDTVNPEDHQRLLDAVRDTFHSLGQRANELRLPDGGNQADLDFTKAKIARETQALMRSTGATAYGETGAARWSRVALTAATLLIGVMPFAYAVYTDPTAWFYILGLAGAYLRTLMLAIGMILAAGTTLQAIWQHVNERQLIWALPALFYSAQQYIITNADDHPQDEKAVAMGHTAKEIVEHKAFLVAVGAIEFALFVSANHPDKVAALWRKLRPKSQASRFAQGQEMATADAEVAEDIRRYFKAGSTLIGILNTITDERVANGERMSDPQRQAMRTMRVDLAQLGGTLETVIGGITTDPAAAQDDQDEEERTRVQRALQALKDAANAVRNLPQTIRDMPLEEKKKLIVGILLSSLGAVLGAISSLAAIRVPALLTDYIPYYIASVLLLVLQTKDEAYTASDVARTFGSYFGGTIIGIIPSIMNLISLFVTQEGFFDIVAHNSTLGLPANATFAPGHPSLELTEHANIHGADGRINFGVMTAVTMLAMLAVGGRLGDDISNKIIASLDASTRNDDGDESEDDEERNDEERNDEERNDEERDGEEDEERRPSGDVVSRDPGEESSRRAQKEPLTELKQLGAEVSREDVDKITRATAAFKKAKDLALELKPEELTFDPANPPPDTPDEELEKAMKLAIQWESALKTALEAESSKAGPSTQ